jgi:GTP cyclohydrolase FolE2
MARGWESKSVESQIEAAEARTSRLAQAKRSAEQIQLEREREGIELSRTRVLQDLASASNPRYQDLLRQSLRFLDEKLEELQKNSADQIVSRKLDRT